MFGVRDRGHATLAGGVMLFVSGSYDRDKVRTRVLQLLQDTHPDLAARLNELFVTAVASTPNRHVGGASAASARGDTGTVWVWKSAGSIFRHLKQEIFDHELAHLCTSSGGAPGRLRWVEAMEGDSRTGKQKAWLRACTAVPGQVAVGGGGVSSYAEAGGPTEDWADSVALWLADRRVGWLAKRSSWLGLRTRKLRFADLFPHRAVILNAYFAGNVADGPAATT